MFSYYEHKVLHTITTDIIKHPLQVSNASLNIKLEIYKIHRDMKDIVLSHSKEELQNLIEKVNGSDISVYKNLSIIEEYILGDSGLILEKRMKKLFNDWKPIRAKVISHVINNKKMQASLITKNEGAQHVLKMEFIADKLYYYARNKAEEFKKKSIEKAKVLEKQTIIFDLLFLLLFILIVYYTIKRISKYMYKSEHLNSVLSIVRDINKMIGVEKDMQALVSKCTKILTKTNIYNNAWILLLDKNRKVEDIFGSNDSDDFRLYKEKIKNGWLPTCIKGNIDNNSVYSKIKNTHLNCDECPLKNANACKNALNIELKHEDKIFGYLTLSVDDNYIDDVTELELLDEIAFDISSALYSIKIAQKLQLSEQRYRTLFQGNRIVELVIDPLDGKIVDCNNKALEYYGYTHKEIMSMFISDLNILSPDEIKEEMQLAKEERRDKFFFKHKLANGDIRDVEVYSGPIELENSTLLYSIIFDITDKLKFEEDKKIIQERLNLVLDASVDGIWDWDILENQIYFSPRWKELLGYSDNELENQFDTWDKLIHPDDKEQAYLDIKTSQDGESEFYKNIHRLKHKNGHWVWIEARGKTIFNEDGKAIRMMGSHTDISEQIESQKTIMYLKELYANIINSVDNLIFVKNIDHKYIECNRAFEKFIGKSKENLIGKSDFDFFDNELAQFFQDRDEEMLAQKKPVSNFEWVTYPDGSRVYLLTVKAPLFDRDGKIIGLVGNSADFTEQHLLYNRLNEAQSIAKIGSWEYNIVKDELIGSQELYNIYGFSDFNMKLEKDSFFKQYHSEDIKVAEQDFQNSLTSKNMTISHNRIIRKNDGEIRFLEHHWKTEYENNVAVRTIGTTQDITEQRKTSDALILNKMRYEVAEKIGKVGSWEYVVDSKEFWASNESKEIYGLPTESESFSTEVVEGCIPEREMVHQALIDLLEKGIEYNLEFEIHPWDGSAPKIISSIARVEFDNSGKPLKVTGFIQDITDKKRTQILLEQKEKRARDNNPRSTKSYNNT